MKNYIFVGLECEIHGVGRLSRFGQRITLSDEMAAHVAAGGGAIIPADTFEAIGFTADELAAYAIPAARNSAPDETKAKFKAAAVAFCDFKASAEANKEAE
jgi:Na+/H+ antiporter NhaA